MTGGLRVAGTRSIGFSGREKPPLDGRNRFAPRHETMVETIAFVGIYRESTHSRVSEPRYEMDVATISTCGFPQFFSGFSARNFGNNPYDPCGCTSDFLIFVQGSPQGVSGITQNHLALEPVISLQRIPSSP